MAEAQIMQRDKMAALLLDEGVVFAEQSEKEFERLTRFMREIVDGLPEYRLYDKGLCLIFFYDRGKQPKGSVLRQPDGIAMWRQIGKDMLFAVGISTYAIEAGTDYLKFVAIHELAHVVHQKARLGAYRRTHELSYHETLEEMLKNYNRRFGTALKNDRAELWEDF